MELPLKSRKYDEIVFSHRFYYGFYMLLVAAVFIGLGGSLEEGSPWAAYLSMGLGAVTVVLSILTLLWRHTMVMRPVSRRYRRTYQSWPGKPTHESGTYQDIRGIVLETVRRQEGAPYYYISISFATVDRLLKIDEGRTEDEARSKLRQWSRELGLDILETPLAPGSGTGKT